jgi:hypothetical protein
MSWRWLVEPFASRDDLPIHLITVVADPTVSGRIPAEPELRLNAVWKLADCLPTRLIEGVVCFPRGPAFPVGPEWAPVGRVALEIARADCLSFGEGRSHVLSLENRFPLTCTDWMLERLPAYG